jgi:hypothetical protein
MGQNMVHQTGMYPDACKAWRLMLEANQTWNAFKVHFANHDRDQLATMTASNAFTGTAFSAHPAPSSSAIQAPNTAIVPTPPLDTMGTALAAYALPSGPELIALLAELAKLRATVAAPAGTTTPKPAQRGYCWTHGSSANAAHTSATCKNKAPGHVDSATYRNKHGGNQLAYVPPVRRFSPRSVTDV